MWIKVQYSQVYKIFLSRGEGIRFLEKKCIFLSLLLKSQKSMFDEEWDFEHQQFKEGASLSDYLNETFKVSIINSTPNGIVSLQMAKASVLNEEMRRKAHGSSSQSENVELEKYSHCMAGKQTRVSFKKHPSSRKAKLLELVYSGVCDPLKEALGLYFEDKGPSVGGIKHEKTPPKTPQLNGLVERMNKTLIERVRYMLSEVKLPKHFSGEILYTTVHVINFSPTVALNIEVSYKIWFGKDVKLYDPIEKKLVRSRDVQFMKDQTIEDIDKVKKTTLEKDNSLSEIDLIWMPVHDLDTIENNVQNGEQHDYVGDQQVGDIFYVPPDDDVEEE
ncbi:hypothetical protein CR513_41272, partial [Mucuna pruriens]